MATLQDYKRDAVSLICYKELIDAENIDEYEPVEEDDIHLIGEDWDEDYWIGHFSSDVDAEVIYSAKYRMDVGKFYITKYLMESCAALDPTQVLY